MLMLKRLYRNFSSKAKKTKIILFTYIITRISTIHSNFNLINGIKNFILKLTVRKYELHSVIMGPICFQLVRTGCHIGLFKYLSENPGASLNEISENLELVTYPTEVLLLGLTSIKLIDKVNDSYYNNPFTTTELVSGIISKYMPVFMEYMHNVIVPAMMHLKESIIQNKPIGLYKNFGEEANDFYYELSKNANANQYVMQCDRR